MACSSKATISFRRRYLALASGVSSPSLLQPGAAGWAPLPSPDPPFELFPTLFPVNAILAAAEWLWSGVALRISDLSVAMSEGGIGWVPMLMDRADYVLSHSASGTESVTWKSDLLPSEVLGRNFYFCSIDDPSAVECRARIGVDHIMVESDYPHADSTWPDTQAVLASTFGHLPEDALQRSIRLFGEQVNPALRGYEPF